MSSLKVSRLVHSKFSSDEIVKGLKRFVEIFQKTSKKKLAIKSENQSLSTVPPSPLIRDRFVILYIRLYSGVSVMDSNSPKTANFFPNFKSRSRISSRSASIKWTIWHARVNASSLTDAVTGLRFLIEMSVNRILELSYDKYTNSYISNCSSTFNLQVIVFNTLLKILQADPRPLSVSYKTSSIWSEFSLSAPRALSDTSVQKLLLTVTKLSFFRCFKASFLLSYNHTHLSLSQSGSLRTLD